MNFRIARIKYCFGYIGTKLVLSRLLGTFRSSPHLASIFEEREGSVVRQTLDGERSAKQVMAKLLQTIFDREAFLLPHVVVLLGWCRLAAYVLRRTRLVVMVLI